LWYLRELIEIINEREGVFIGKIEVGDEEKRERGTRKSEELTGGRVCV
jgi:hypothetical protein